MQYCPVALHAMGFKPRAVNFSLYNVNKIIFFVFLSHEYSNKTKGPRHWTAQPFISGTRFISTYTLVPEVFLDFSSRKRSRGSREAATTSRESDEEREKTLYLPWPRISLSCRRQLSNASNC